MATIVKRGKSYSVVYYKTKGKKKEQVWESGLSYITAKSRKGQIEREQAENIEPVADIKDMTMRDFLKEYIEKYGLKKWTASTYTGNMGLIENYILPYWEDKKIRLIRTKSVDDYYHYLEVEAEPATNMGKPMRDHITASTIHDIHKLLRCAFNLAVRWEYLSKNPFLNATLPEHHEKPREVLSPDQVARVLKFTFRPQYYEYYLMHCAILIAVGCTMRGGEIGALQWERVNFEKNTFYIDRVIDRVKKADLAKLRKIRIYYKFPNLYPGTKTLIVLKGPKTEETIRTIEVPRTVMEALRNLKTMQEKWKNELGKDGYMDYNLVICQANGRPIMTEHLNAKFKDLLAEMKDPEINAEEYVFHSLRHTSASTKLRLSHGDYNSVKQAGGWANLEMLTRRYGTHSFDTDRERLADQMDTFLDQTLQPPAKEKADSPEAPDHTSGKTDKPASGPSISTEQALQALAQADPDLLMKIVQSIQSDNT